MSEHIINMERKKKLLKYLAETGFYLEGGMYVSPTCEIYQDLCLLACELIAGKEPVQVNYVHLCITFYHGDSQK